MELAWSAKLILRVFIIKSKFIPNDTYNNFYQLLNLLVMPFDLANAPATFNQMMSRILNDHKNFMATFFDNIIICFKDKEEHQKHLEIVSMSFKNTS